MDPIPAYGQQIGEGLNSKVFSCDIPPHQFALKVIPKSNSNEHILWEI